MKRIYSFLLVILVAFLIIGCGEVTEPQTEPTIDPVEENDQYAYIDAYFDGTTSKDDLALVKLSCNLAVNAIGNNTNATRILQAIGFSNIECIGLDVKNNPDSVATVMATRNSGDTDVVLIIVRGVGYEAEWVANFVAGSDGDIEGFKMPMEIVLNRLNQYMEKYQIKNTKIWATGYSRGAGICNLLGVHLNENLALYELNADDLFIYTFEAPNGSSSTNTYNNIINIINQNDLITYVYPKDSDWTMMVNGIPFIIQEASIINTYKDFTMSYDKQVSASYFLNDFFNWFTSFISREKYHEELEPLIVDFLNIYYQKNSNDREKIKNLIKSEFLGKFLNLSESPSIIQLIVKKLTEADSDYLYSRIFSEIARTSDPKAENMGIFKEGEWEQIKEDLFQIMRIVLPLLFADYEYIEGIDYQLFYQYIKPEYFLTDEERGYQDGFDYGFTLGYAKGLEDVDLNIQPAVNVFGNAYQEQFDLGYRKGYDQGFLEGVKCKESKALRGAYDGALKGAEQGFNDGYYLNNKKEGTIAPDVIEEWMNEEYLEAYSLAYLSSYNQRYDEVYQVMVNCGEKMSLYHVATLVKNLNFFMENHYADENYLLVSLMN